jgi:hypothetical protein
MVSGAPDSSRKRTVTSFDVVCGLTSSRNVLKNPCDPSANSQVVLSALAPFSPLAP